MERPWTSDYASASHMPSITTTSPHPRHPTFNDHPGDPFRPRPSINVDSHNQPHYASSHIPSSAATPIHRPSSTSYEPRRPPRDPRLDTEHPPFVDEDGELMVWIDDDVYNQMEASRRGGGMAQSWQRSVFDGQSFRGPVYGNFQSSRGLSFGDEDYGQSRWFRELFGGRSARGLSGGLDAMFDEGGLFGHEFSRHSWGDQGGGRDLWSDY
ncbi:hypothetical protein FB567DRAFT_582302 [Paraphoma chrysanthemicola]|uniref:Uncharacterized protein n=1 Tax=Paraphoma chrysanthemicola TaxID=798071 RepID=A0A8K0VV97_9PLEO|nr:hypothetical protein FB567DRAFT_582302 [Paraphoma chrysanthemicola]